MDEYTLKQLFAELIDAQEQAFAVLANAMADVTDRPRFAAALAARLATAQAANGHPIRDSFLTIALRAVQAK